MKKIFLLLSLFVSVTVFDSCTDLEEDVLDESLTGGVSAEDVAIGALAPVYGLLPEIYNHINYFALQEISTDEAILPFRGGTDWWDNGVFVTMHQHTYNSQNLRIEVTWNNIMVGISRAVTAINILEPMAGTDANARAFLAEARAMRAFYSLMSLDLFGLVFVKDALDEESDIRRGDAAVEFIRTELLAVENEVSTSVGPGRITKGAVWGLLARLHLNAPVYRDPFAADFTFSTAEMDKVIEYCDKVIALGQYGFSAEYFEIFDDENHTNDELIFAVDQRADLSGHNRMAYFSLSGDQFPLPAYVNANGTDGAGITSDFYQTWEDAYGPKPEDFDPRVFKYNLDSTVTCIAGSAFEINRGILRKQQYGLITTSKGQPFERCGPGDANYTVGKLYTVTRGKPNDPVFFTRAIDFGDNSGHSSGYRVEKYEFSKKSDSGRNKGEADISIIRYADIYMMRAEAKLRKGDTDGALTDVNTVRTSRTARVVPAELGSITLDLLYRERGFEFYWEMLRRTDMIRFGKYEDSWTEKTDNDKRKRLFPIPQSAIDGASNKPGYLVQNDSY